MDSIGIAVEVLSERDAKLSSDLSARVLELKNHAPSPQLKGLAILHREKAVDPTVIRIRTGEKARVNILHIYGNIYNQKTDGFAVYPRHLILVDENAVRNRRLYRSASSLPTHAPLQRPRR